MHRVCTVKRMYGEQWVRPPGGNYNGNLKIKMVRYLYIIFVMLFFASCNERNDHWFIWRQADNAETKKIIQKNIEHFDFINDELPDGVIDNFHLIDVDRDNDLDFVYNGWTGGESKLLVFYLAKNGAFSKSFSTWGTLEDVSQNKDDIFTMYVNLPGCCGDYEIRDYKIKTIVEKDSLTFDFFETKIRHGDTNAPTTFFKEPINFEIINDSYYLRVTPEIDTTNYFFPGEGPAGNSYITFQAGDKGRALGEKTDDSGRVWWYVEMNENKKHSRDEINGTKVFPKFMGWMSSRFLKIKNDKKQ